MARQIHHFLMWFFILFAIVHIYLVFYHDYIEQRGEDVYKRQSPNKGMPPPANLWTRCWNLATKTGGASESSPPAGFNFGPNIKDIPPE